MMLMLALALATQPLHQDCGYKLHLKELRASDALIVKRAALQDLVGEMPTKSGHSECARLAFNIDAEGHAENITLEESSGDMMLILSARGALGAYRFKPMAPAGRYMLIFRAIVGKAPPLPSVTH